MGKGRVQERAIAEVAGLPADDPYRQNALDLLGNLKVILEARATIEPDDRELIMQLSPLYLEKIQAAELVGEERGRQIGEERGRHEGEQELVTFLITEKIGEVSPELIAKIAILPSDRVQELAKALFNFNSIDDLTRWFATDR
jgi:predicted transposase YdaD